MIRRLAPALLLLTALPAGLALAQEQSIELADRRLAQVAERLQAANVGLCRQHMPLTGLIVFSADQYGQPDPVRFAGGPVAVAQVLPGSPAHAAGVQANDAIVTVDGVPLAEQVPEEGYTLRDTTFDILAEHGPGHPLVLGLRRQGQDVTATITPPPGCRALVEVVAGRQDIARSDGRVIQISWSRVAQWNDEELAVIVAHELAHSVLEHRRRLAAAGVEGGLLGEFGRNRRLRRLVEEDADVLSVHLLANAGYDPQIAPQFWRSETGARLDAGILRSGAYASPNRRAAMMEAEIAAHLATTTTPSRAEHLLAGRDVPYPLR
jgi:hypothetical protein